MTKRRAVCWSGIIFFATVLIIALANDIYAAQPEPIIFLHYYSSSHGEAAMDKMINIINTEHPQFHVKATSFKHEPFKVSIKAMLVGGNPPDIFLYWAGARVQSLVDAGYLESIDDLWEQTNLDERFTPAVAQACTYNGHKYVIPLTQFYVAFFYNKEIFDEHNIPVPNTWAEFLTVCQQLKAAGITPIALGSMNRWPAQFWFDYLLLRTAGPEYRQRLMTGNASYLDTEVKKVFASWKQLVEQGYFNQNPNVYNSSEAAKMVFHNQAAMTLMGTWKMGILDQLGWQQQQDYDFFPFPSIDPNVPGTSVGPIDGVVLPKKGEIKAAKTVLPYFSEIAPQQEMSQAVSSLSPNQNVPRSDYTELQQRILNIIAETPYWAFNYDLATPPSVAEAGLDSFAKFLDHPDRYLEILNELEAQAKAYFHTQ